MSSYPGGTSLDTGFVGDDDNEEAMLEICWIPDEIILCVALPTLNSFPLQNGGNEDEQGSDGCTERYCGTFDLSRRIPEATTWCMKTTLRQKRKEMKNSLRGMDKKIVLSMCVIHVRSYHTEYCFVRRGFINNIIAMHGN